MYDVFDKRRNNEVRSAALYRLSYHGCWFKFQLRNSY